MYCKNCGQTVSNNERFCKNCGVEVTTNDVSVSKPESKNKRQVIIFGIAAIFVIFVLIKLFVKPTINLNDYADVTFSGTKESVQAEVDFNKDKFDEKYKGKLHINEKKFEKKLRKYLDEHLTDFISEEDSAYWEIEGLSDEELEEYCEDLVEYCMDEIELLNDEMEDYPSRLISFNYDCDVYKSDGSSYNYFGDNELKGEKKIMVKWETMLPSELISDCLNYKIKAKDFKVRINKKGLSDGPLAG